MTRELQTKERETQKAKFEKIDTNFEKRRNSPFVPPRTLARDVGERGTMGKNGNNRERKMDGESTIPKSALKGLQFNNDNKPAFLRNALAALSGQQATSSRQTLPERPDIEGPDSDEDDWDLGGDDAPAVVVLKGKHLDREEVDKLRADGQSLVLHFRNHHSLCVCEAKANDTADPISAATTTATKTKQASTLNFSTSATKRKINETESGKSWDEVVKRFKVDGETAEEVKKVKEAVNQKGKEKGEKAKQKKKKVEAKKVSMLSFDDE